VTFVPVSPPVFPSRWEEKKYVVALRLFGIVPFGQQTIDLSIPLQSETHRQRRWQRLASRGFAYEEALTSLACN